MEQIRGGLVLLFCAAALSPQELNGAPLSHHSTPFQPENTTLHAPKQHTMITTAKPSQEPMTAAAFTARLESRLETTTGPVSKSTNHTTQRPSPPMAFQPVSNTEKPNSTSAVEMSTNHTIALDKAVTTDPHVLSTTLSHSDANQTGSFESHNHTAMISAKPYTSKPTPTAKGASTQSLSTYATPKTPEPTTAPTSAYASTRTTRRTTTRMTAHPFKPKTPAAKTQSSETNGIVAAVLIGLILLMMFVGIIFIWVKKCKWQRRQLENSEWAGPSPFLDGSTQPHFSTDSTRQESKRISIAGFLHQNLSKSNSLLNDMEEGIDMDILPGTTFGQHDHVETKPANGTFQEKKGETEHEQDNKSAKSASENVQTTTDAAIHDPNPKAEMEDNNSGVNPNETPSAQPPPTSTSTNTPPPPPDIDLRPLEDTTPASDVQVPPAPPLPQA
ncbi:protein EVI2B [Alosa sapidissima]|uniref:protein EVI2B n=1 Tax=Alosa sapidissima TaxID=34773 RepID=UPI001C0988BB|nr:protein EVI2B [Alosa sapidissima]